MSVSSGSITVMQPPRWLVLHGKAIFLGAVLITAVISLLCSLVKEGDGQAKDGKMLLEPTADPNATAVESVVRPFISTPMTPRKRQKEMEALARAGDQLSFKALLALVSHPEYGLAAIAAMRELPSTELREQALPVLRNEMTAGDTERACLAAAVYAALLGPDAVPGLMEFIRHGHARPEQQRDVVCSFAADLLGEIGTASAQSALISELARVGSPDWTLNYGSAVVRNLVRSVLSDTGAPATNAATHEFKLAPSVVVVALEEYAKSLEHAGSDTGLGRKRGVREQKIAEARRAAVRLAGTHH